MASTLAIRFFSISAKFGICTIVGLNGTLAEAEIRTWDTQCAYFSFNKCSIKTRDSASAKFSNNWDETEYSVPVYSITIFSYERL